MTDQNRQPAGVPTGGQFAASAHTESSVALGAAEAARAAGCPCDYNPSTTEGPDEFCPVHGRDEFLHPGYSKNGWRLRTDEPYKRLSLETSNRSARELARLAQEGQIDTDPPYQRGNVWTPDQRVALVKSWLQGVPVPAIMVNDRTNSDYVRANGDEHMNTGQGMYAVVDGKQRLETARMWFNSEFAVPASWFPAEDVERVTETPNGPFVTFDGLGKRGQAVMGMGGAMLPMTTAKLATVEEEADLYLLVNGGGTAQSEADMDNARSFASKSSQ